LLLDIKNTIKQSAIYGLSRISLKFVSFILTPVISIYFTVSEYGILDRFERFWQIIFAISLFGIETALLRWYTLTEDKEKKKSLIFTILAFLIIVNVILILFGILFSVNLSSIIFDSAIYNNIIIYTFLIACFEALMVVPLTLLRAENKPGKYFLITLSATIISLLLQLYFLLYTTNKLEGIFISKFVAPFIVFILLIPFIIKHINFKFDKVYFIDIIKFSFPLMLTGIVSTLLNSVNRFILGFIGRPDDVGLFSLASNISGIMTFILISPFQLAFNAIFWQKQKDSNAARFYTKSVTYSVLLYVWGALVLSLLVPYIIKLYIPTRPAYWEAGNLVPILSLSLVFYGMLTISYMSYHQSKRNDLIFYFQTGALILNIALNYLLIPKFQMYGAAFATFISFFILIASMYYFSRNYYFIKYETMKLIVIFAVASIIIFTFQYISIPHKWTDISLRITACVSFPFILYIFKVYEPVEISTAKSFIKKYLRLNVK
jgi:O-antigen/teichoic acid export membrane protein